MNISLKAEGLFDPKVLASWDRKRRAAARQAVAQGMRSGGWELTEMVRAHMRTAFQIRRPVFLKSMRAKVYTANPSKPPALLIGSKSRWLGIHETGGTVTGKRGFLLIPIQPEHRRIGPKRFRAVLDGLFRSGNAWFVRQGQRTILMAENIRDNDRQLSSFKVAARQRSGAKRLQRGADITVAVLVRSVHLRPRLELERTVRRYLGVIAAAIQRELARI